MWNRQTCTSCVCVHEHMVPMNSLDALHHTFSSSRDWLWLRLDRQDCRKLMSESPSNSFTFFRCCAAAKLEDTLDHSSVVGYKCKAIQWLVLSQQVETPAYGQALWVVQYHRNVRHMYCVNTQSTSICMHISYLPHNVWGTRLTPPATSHTSQQFATLAQGSCTAQWSSSNTSSLEGLQLLHQHL